MIDAAFHQRTACAHITWHDRVMSEIHGMDAAHISMRMQMWLMYVFTIVVFDEPTPAIIRHGELHMHIDMT